MSTTMDIDTTMSLLCVAAVVAAMLCPLGRKPRRDPSRLPLETIANVKRIDDRRIREATWRNVRDL